MKSKRVLEVLTICLVIFLLIPTQVVMASTQITISGTSYAQNTGTEVISGRYANTVNRLQLRYLQHQSGKIIILNYADKTHFNINIYSSIGTLLSTEAISTSVYGGVTVADYSATEILVSYGTTTFNVYFDVVNVNTFVRTSYHSTWSGKGGADSLDRLSGLFYYNGAWYIGAWYASYLNGGGGYMRWCKMVKSTHTCTTFGDTNYQHNGYMNEVMGFQDTTNLNLVYIVTSKNGINAGDYSTAQYYILDLSTDTFTVLATGGTSGVLPDANDHLKTQPYSNMINYAGGGIYASGTYQYLWHSWVYSYNTTTGIRYVKTALWIGEFNNTISSGTLTNQITKIYEDYDKSLTTCATPGLGFGYSFNAQGSATITVYMYYQDLRSKSPLPGLTYISKATLSDTDITDMSSNWDSTQITLRQDNIDFSLLTPVSTNTNMMKDHIHGKTYVENINTNTGYLILGEPIQVITYTVTTSYLPVDNPLLTLKPYSFTFTIYANGVLDNLNDTYKIFVDGQQAGQGIIPQTGIVTINNIQSLVATTHTIYISIYHNGYFEYSSTQTNYVFVASGSGNTIPEGTDLGTGYYTLLTVWVPIFLVVMVPSFCLALVGAKFGTLGMMVGLLFGAFVGILGGVLTNILPQYALYLYILVMAVCFAILAKGNGGN